VLLTIQFHTPVTDGSTQNVQTDGVLTILSTLNVGAVVQVFCGFVCILLACLILKMKAYAAIKLDTIQ
jgi:hypothetical protein